MENDQERIAGLYCTILYDKRAELNISIAEYFYLDMVDKLSRKTGWCHKTVENCARDMGVSKRGLIVMRERLIKRGLLERNAAKYVRVTSAFTEVAVYKVHQEQKNTVHKVPRLVKKVHLNGEKSAPKSYKRVTRDLEKVVDNAEEAKQRIRERMGWFKKEQASS